MDTYEATKIVMSRIQNLDPENASRIMGYILIQDQGEKEMIRLAFSPEAHLLSYINQAKAGLGFLPSSSPSSNPSTPLSYPIRPNSSFPPNSPRIMIPNNGFHLSNPPSPAAPFQRSSPRPISYAAVLDGSVTNNGTNNGSGSPSLHFYGGNDEFLSGGVHHQVQEQLPFLDDSVVDPIMSPSGRSDSLVFPYGEDGNGVPSPHPHPFHRRSCSVNDAAFLSNLEDGGGGNGFLWRPCMYFARGFCKNGSTCKFLHSDVDPIDVGSPNKTGSGFDELLRMKALQNQRFAFMASGGHHPFAYNKCMDILNENPRCDLSPMGFGAGASSSSRQIYLTFPADSTFKEEDVSNYFSMFGPVQDVRIPYQQKRMFGFVTFVYPETVKLILAKGNPHFVCDSRVLVKPYKEKGKVREKKQQQQHLERGEYSACLSPSGVDSREPFDHLPFGSRMLFSPQEMMLRRKLEQEAELQHAIELQDACQEAVDEKFATERTESSLTTEQMLMTLISKKAAENQSVFSQASAPADDSTHVTITSSNNTPVLPTGSPLTIASLKSCYFQMPRYRPRSIVTVSLLLSPFKRFTYTPLSTLRFSSGQEAIEM
ncbi:Zinc finger CCCH domain-containing protein 23 [Sesamum angolense]|uniref:Zinc finger CCCH domain-containing protein 23 n=1 Tax=Sesamum angolense TaxID=2727404 RepID=A0AAE1X9K9_9LAMI|nr:Zinc finger CCCH domain-containing protein 23 [Sesamum angolense]